MNRLLIPILMVMAFACKPIVDNSPQNFDQVFSKSSFEIEIREYGCFSSYEEYFDVTRIDGNYKIVSESTGRSHLIPKTKMDSLQNYLKANIGNESRAICIFNEYIRVGTFFNSIAYQQTVCGGPEELTFNDLLNYHDLTNEPFSTDE